MLGSLDAHFFSCWKTEVHLVSLHLESSHVDISSRVVGRQVLVSHCHIIQLVTLNIRTKLHGELVVLIGCINDANLRAFYIPKVVNFFLLLLLLNFFVSSIKKLQFTLSIWLELGMIKK